MHRRVGEGFEANLGNSSKNSAKPSINYDQPTAIRSQGVCNNVYLLPGGSQAETLAHKNSSAQINLASHSINAAYKLPFDKARTCAAKIATAWANTALSWQ